MNNKTLQSIGAVLAGAAAGVAVTLATDAVLHKVGVFPPTGQPASDGPLALATLYRTIYGVGGAYLTARLAPSRPMLHVMFLGGLGFIASLAGAIATWNKMEIYGPHWYPVALVVLALPQSWLGGWLRERKLRVRVAG
jgi:hypothetical protein